MELPAYEVISKPRDESEVHAIQIHIYLGQGQEDSEHKTMTPNIFSSWWNTVDFLFLFIDFIYQFQLKFNIRLVSGVPHSG